MVVLRCGLGGPWSPRFLAGPLFAPNFLLNFTFKFVWLTYKADNIQPTKFQTIWRLSGDGSDDIHKSMFGLIRLIIANQSWLQWKITMQERYLCCPLYFFPWPPSAPYFFHSRIAAVTPVSHSLTRLIHICPSCCTIYRPFEITLEMETVYWIELQIQCSTQIHCFKKHSVRYELCFKKYLAA